MADRKAAFEAWSKGGPISDDDLKQVVNDLETFVEIMDAMKEHGYHTIGYRTAAISVRQMYELRRKG